MHVQRNCLIRKKHKSNRGLQNYLTMMVVQIYKKLSLGQCESALTCPPNTGLFNFMEVYPSPEKVNHSLIHLSLLGSDAARQDLSLLRFSEPDRYSFLLMNSPGKHAFLLFVLQHIHFKEDVFYICFLI